MQFYFRNKMKSYSKIICLTSILLIIVFGINLAKSKIESTPNINEVTPSTQVNQNLIPFWKSDTIYNESMLLVSYNNGQPESPFLFPYVNIISVQNSALNLTYTPGIDWMFKDNKLILPTGSRIPYLKDTEVATPSLSTPPEYFHTKQVSVTYSHSGKWNGPIPRYSPDLLPNTIKKLDSASPLKIALYGDSISVGYNSSGLLNIPPYLPNWGKLVVEALGSNYSSPITFLNPSVAGMTSNWGASNVETLVSVNLPDLVIIAFGMNDGTNMPPTIVPTSVETFKNNLINIMNNVKYKNPNAEFILISTTLMNPAYSGSIQSQYITAIKTLEQVGVAVVDMTSVHEELLKTKKFADITGNNINHPNDFLSRWYAQETIGLFIPPTLAELEMKPVKGTTDKNTIYLVEKGIKRRYPNEAIFLASFTYPQVIQLSDATLSKIPLGSPMGTSIKPGDLNGDGKVNIYDYSRLISGYGTIYSNADFINILTNYGK